MSDLFKLLFTIILHCALLTAPTLMAQETPPVVNEPAQQSESKPADVPEDPQPAVKLTGTVPPSDSGASTTNTDTLSRANEIELRMLPLVLELGELKLKFGNDHPKTKALERRIEFTRKFLEKFKSLPLATVVHLRNAEASEVVKKICILYPRLVDVIVADERTNSVMIRGGETQIREIEQLIEVLDKEVSPAGNDSDPLPFQNDLKLTTGTSQAAAGSNPFEDSPESVASGTGVPIAAYRRQLDALEQPALQLAEQVRAAETKQGKDHPDSAKLRADLRAAVQQTFAARQEIQRAELAEFTRRLQRMQQSIDSRDRIVDRIVDRRVEELLDPNLNWAQPQSGKVASVASPKPPELLDVGQIGENVQKVTLTMFDVTDASFMKEREINAEPSLAPTDLNEQLLRMKESKTVKIQGIHKIETILNQTATFHSGGTFKVPVSSGGEFVKDREFGTRITIRPHLQGDEKIFECVWSELLVNWNTSINGFPGVDEKRLSVVVKSPLPGGTGYLCGPFAGSDSSHRRFISFYLHGADDATKSATEGTEKSSALQTSVPQKAVQNVNAPETLASGSQLATLPGSGFVVAANDQTSPPQSDAEKAIARFVLVFFQDEARRAVPGLMIDHGTETLILTTGPATIVPDGASHAIDRTFVEVPGATAVEAEFLNTKTADIRIHRAKSGLTQFQLKEPVTLKIDDSLSAILLSGQPTLRVTPKAARVAALDQPATFSLATHKFRHEFTGLIQIDQRLPEGTPLFKDGELAGITLLGTRFMKDDMPGSFVVPVSRIVEVLQQLKMQDEGPSAEPNETASPTPLSETSVADELP